MADGLMTADARHILRLRMRTDHIDDVLVAMPASVFGHAPVPRLDAQWIGILARRESEGMPETVVRFDGVFADEIMWRVAIVAGGDVPVARLQPRVVMILHHMAIRARLRIVPQIRIPLGVNESVAADAYSDSQDAPDENPFDHTRSHPARS